jgi:hypothetical protein
MTSFADSVGRLSYVTRVATSMRNPHVLSATRRWHRSDLTFHFLRLFSVSSCPKITHLFLKDFVKTKPIDIMHQMQSARYLISFSDDNSTDRMPMHRHCFLLPKPCRIFPRCDVNRDKSDVTTSFGLIDRTRHAQLIKK